MCPRLSGSSDIAVSRGAEMRSRVCLIPHIPGVAGPANFQRRLAAGLTSHGIEVSHSLDDRPYTAILVAGGSRHMAGLWRARRRGIPVVQRLAGLNWIHRRRRTGLRHFLRAEANNILLRLIRDRLATAIVYQSQFAREWWERVHGPAPVGASVVYNGVPLGEYAPSGDTPPSAPTRLLVVEGNWAGGYEVGLAWAIGLAERLLRIMGGIVELSVAGQVGERLRRQAESASRVPIRWLGLIPPADIPSLDRSAHLLFASDVNPACPNSVVEALACGLPIASFATGALPELVTNDAGRVVPYGGDVWRLDPPDLDSLADAAQEILADQPRFRRGARARAEAGLGLETMVQGYLRALGESGPGGRNLAASADSP